MPSRQRPPRSDGRQSSSSRRRRRTRRPRPRSVWLSRVKEADAGSQVCTGNGPAAVTQGAAASDVRAGRCPAASQFAEMEKAAATAAEGIGAKFAVMFEGITVAVGAATMGKAIYAALGPVGIAFLAAEAIYMVIDHQMAEAERRDQVLLDLISKAKAETSDFKRQLATVDTAPQRDAMVQALDQKVKELIAARDDAQKAADALEAARVTHKFRGVVTGRDDKTDEQVSLERTVNLRQGEADLVDRIRGKAENLSSEELSRRSIEQAITTEIEGQSKALSDMIAKLPSILVGLKDAAHQAELANNLANQADATGKLAVLRGEQSRLLNQAANLNLKAGGSADAMFGGPDDITQASKVSATAHGARATLSARRNFRRASSSSTPKRTLLPSTRKYFRLSANKPSNYTNRRRPCRSRTADYNYRLGPRPAHRASGEQGAADQMERQHGIAEACHEAQR